MSVARPPVLRARFDEELVVDSFAGGGGASTGIEAALGRPVDLAINHDPEAIAMHAANHPETRLQVCGYAMALDPRPARAALQLLPDGRYRLERYRDRSDEHDWIAACRVAHFRLAHSLAYLED